MKLKKLMIQMMEMAPSLSAAMNKMKDVTSFRLASLLRQQRDPKLALQLFLNPNSDFYPNPNRKPFPYSLLSYDLIITKLGRAKMFDELDQILCKLKLERRFTPTEIIFCNVITFCARAQLPDKALQVFDEMPSFRCQRTVKSLNTLLNGMLTCREFDKMRKIFVGMGQFACPDTCTYNVMINACRARNDLDGAWKLFDEMPVRGLQPNAVTFSTLISGLCANLKLEEALKLKRNMTRIYNVTPNVNVYASLIKGFCELQELTLAYRLKDEMVVRNIQVNSSIYTTLISGLFKAGRKDDAHDLFEEMKKSSCKPKTETYNALIAGYCGDKCFDLALQFLSEMEEQGCKPDVISYNVLIQAYCKEEKLREAIDLFEDMPRRGCKPDVVSYRMLFDGLFGAMKLEEAAFVLDEMIFKGYAPHSTTISKFMKLLYQEGKLELLLEVLSTLAKGNCINIDLWTFAISTVSNKDELLNFHDLFSTLTTSCTRSP